MQSTVDTGIGPRVLIIGNSGSGKSWLASQLGRKLRFPHIDLDDLYFVGSGYTHMRTKEDTVELALVKAQQNRWVIEGIYGWLAQALLVRATHLVWLTLPEEQCMSNIAARGNRGSASPESFLDLLEWANTYRTRKGSSAFGFHERLFSNFQGAKYRLNSRDEVSTLALIEN
ncbi:P-loop NTPase family protein [Pseudomonas huanghezhanensis]|uniref:adenylate kinase n=1 Tax=Pseudomonas huanghezhanensis TaxID=3002903 RepID=UPI0022856FAB|nr:adenylate kinase [Pseudomonas sp. BSw22131]